MEVDFESVFACGAGRAPARVKAVAKGLQKPPFGGWNKFFRKRYCSREKARYVTAPSEFVRCSPLARAEKKGCEPQKSFDGFARVSKVTSVLSKAIQFASETGAEKENEKSF